MDITKSFSSSLIDSYSFSHQNVDENVWIESMRKSFVDHNHDQAEIEKHPISIFNVPKVLLATHPESYIPQQVALGPFHHWRPEVYEMQRYKLARAQKTQTLMNVRFDHIVNTMKKNDEKRIRGCYHKFLNISGDALMWMLIVDVAFLLDFLRLHYLKEGSQMVDVSRKKLSHIVILRDFVMVENQIPLFLVKKMLDHQSSTDNPDNDADETLKSMLTRVYNELSPFKFGELLNVEIEDCDHLLDYMYRMTVPNIKTQDNNNNETGIDLEYDSISIGNGGYEQDSFSVPSDLGKTMNFMGKKLSKSSSTPVNFIGKFIAFLMNPQLKEPAKKMVKSTHGFGDSSHDVKVPLIDEVTIPSVTKMIQAGFIISPVNGSISSIDFCDKTCTLYLPIIDLDENTEVYLRNLVAYEACIASGPLIVARYTELMNGIIDTKEDAKYLRKKGIVLNHLKSDKEVADLWNGMNKSVKLTKVHNMDEVISNVNKRYRKNWRVKLTSSLKKYVYGAWKFLTLLAALFMLVLTVLQAFCSVYTCTRVLYQVSDAKASPGN